MTLEEFKEKLRFFVGLIPESSPINSKEIIELAIDNADVKFFTKLLDDCCSITKEICKPYSGGGVEFILNVGENYEKYFKLEGYYDSYEGLDLDDVVDGWKEVKAVQKTYTVYEEIK
jgi:hypothetical protein